MNAFDHHIIASLNSLSAEGKEHARKVLGASKPIKKKKDDTVERQKMINTLFK
jgi:hypothetical protein